MNSKFTKKQKQGKKIKEIAEILKTSIVLSQKQISKMIELKKEKKKIKDIGQICNSSLSSVAKIINKIHFYE